MSNTKHDATPAPGKLVDIFQLAELKGRSVRQLRTMLAKGQLSHYRLGYRSLVFDPAQFDRDLKHFEVKSVGGRNGRGK